jgi:hypothetical protein
VATVFEYIENGAYDKRLDDIMAAIKQRKQILGLETRAQIRPGDVVRFSNRIHPRYLIGKTAVVVKLNRKTVVVNCPNDSSYGRFQNSHNVRCPNDMIEGM